MADVLKKPVVWTMLALLGVAVVAWVGRDPGAPVTPLVIESAGGRHAFSVEVADTDESRDKGLQFRTSLPADGGMLFDYRGPRTGVAFWMKDTPLVLDILFISPDARILRIEANAEPQSEVPIPAGGVIRAVLELPGGTSERLGIVPGDSVRHQIFGDELR